jgi:hypothetical protein
MSKTLTYCAYLEPSIHTHQGNKEMFQPHTLTSSCHNGILALFQDIITPHDLILPGGNLDYKPWLDHAKLVVQFLY